MNVCTRCRKQTLQSSAKNESSVQICSSCLEHVISLSILHRYMQDQFVCRIHEGAQNAQRVSDIACSHCSKSLTPSAQMGLNGDPILPLVCLSCRTVSITVKDLINSPKTPALKKVSSLSLYTTNSIAEYYDVDSGYWDSNDYVAVRRLIGLLFSAWDHHN